MIGVIPHLSLSQSWLWYAISTNLAIFIEQHHICDFHWKFADFCYKIHGLELFKVPNCYFEFKKLSIWWYLVRKHSFGGFQWRYNGFWSKNHNFAMFGYFSRKTIKLAIFAKKIINIATSSDFSSLCEPILWLKTKLRFWRFWAPIYTVACLLCSGV